MVILKNSLSFLVFLRLIRIYSFCGPCLNIVNCLSCGLCFTPFLKGLTLEVGKKRRNVCDLRLDKTAPSPFYFTPKYCNSLPVYIFLFLQIC